MKKLVFLLLWFFPFVAIADEDVTAIYEKVVLEKTAIVLTPLSGAEEVNEILVQTDEIKDGTYRVEVTRVENHIYKIDGTNFYLKMPYCYEYSYSEDAILKVTTYAGYKMGTLIWVKE